MAGIKPSSKKLALTLKTLPPLPGAMTVDVTPNTPGVVAGGVTVVPVPAPVGVPVGVVAPVAGVVDPVVEPVAGVAAGVVATAPGVVEPEPPPQAASNADESSKAVKPGRLNRTG